MKEIVGKTVLIFAVLAIISATCSAANPALEISGTITNAESSSPFDSQTKNGGTKEVAISIKNTGGADIGFEKIELSFVAGEINIFDSNKARKAFTYTDTRFAGVTIEPRGFFNTSAAIPSQAIANLVRDPDVFPSISSIRQPDHIDLILILYHNGQALDNGYISSIPLKEATSRILIPQNSQFSFTPIN